MTQIAQIEEQMKIFEEITSPNDAKSPGFGLLLTGDDSTADKIDQLLFVAALFQGRDFLGQDRSSKYDSHAIRLQKKTLPTHRQMRAGNSDGVDWKLHTSRQSNEARLEFADFARFAPRPLREHAAEKSLLQALNGFANHGRAGVFAIDWFDVGVSQNPTDHGDPEQIVAGQETDRPTERQSNQQRIDKTGMIAQNQTAAGRGNVFQASSTKSQPSREENLNHHLE